jgi:hypothetical protein
MLSKIILSWFNYTMEQHVSENVNSCWNTKIIFHLESLVIKDLIYV